MTAHTGTAGTLDGPAAPVATPSLRRRLAGQGSLLFLGYAAAQGFSFLRNALVGHALSKGDFGVAATITLLLQLVETLSDLGTDRLIVQAKDGDSERFVANAHATTVGRGLVTAVLLYLAAEPAARFFAIPHAAWALELVALVPLIKGFQHLDYRRAQRHLDNRPQVLIEVLPQALALLATLPLVTYAASFDVALWLALVQALAMVAASHLMAERPYRIAVEHATLRRFLAFGWPIWLSAFPLVAVYQGDRLIVGKLYGMEPLAAFSAAFMITMVPGLVASKVGHALMLPVLSAARDDGVGFRRRFSRLSDATALAAAAYILVFVAAGGVILPLAFGSQYSGLGPLVGWLAVMWGFRMMQAVPGMALIALGNTRPFLEAGLVRAAGLVLSLIVAFAGYGLSAIAAAGAIAELASLGYVAWRLSVDREGLATPFLLRSLLLVPAALAGLALAA